MNEFKDREGNRYKIDLAIGNVLRVKNESDGRFNLFDPQHADLADRIEKNDFEALYELLWFIVRPEAEAKQTDATKFGELMAADCLVEAREVLWRVWKDFFRQLQRHDQEVALERIQKYSAKALELMKAKIAGPLLAEIDAEVEAEMEATMNQRVGNMRESLASILANTRSANSGE